MGTAGGRPDGIGNSPAYVKHIMEESMEALIHHSKMATHGVEVPANAVFFEERTS